MRYLQAVFFRAFVDAIPAVFLSNPCNEAESVWVGNAWGCSAWLWKLAWVVAHLSLPGAARFRIFLLLLKVF